MKKILGTGGGNSKLVHPGVRTGANSRGSSPASANQLGAATAFKREAVEAGRGYDGAKYGNEVALNSKSAPGQGRTIHPCGSQNQWGPANPGGPSPQPKDFLSAFGPERRKG
jgi:hypothetical protein